MAILKVNCNDLVGLGSREFQFCSSMRRNKNCCGLLGSGIVTMVGSTSECCSDISGCIVPIVNVDTTVGEESIGKIMEDMEQCKFSTKRGLSHKDV